MKFNVSGCRIDFKLAHFFAFQVFPCVLCWLASNIIWFCDKVLLSLIKSKLNESQHTHTHKHVQKVISLISFPLCFATVSDLFLSVFHFTCVVILLILFFFNSYALPKLITLLCYSPKPNRFCLKRCFLLLFFYLVFKSLRDREQEINKRCKPNILITIIIMILVFETENEAWDKCFEKLTKKDSRRKWVKSKKKNRDGQHIERNLGHPWIYIDSYSGF